MLFGHRAHTFIFFLSLTLVSIACCVARIPSIIIFLVPLFTCPVPIYSMFFKQQRTFVAWQIMK